MVDPVAFVARYLAPSLDEAWAWSPERDVLELRDGRTIAFRAQVEAVLRHVAATAGVVPPFRAVVYLLAALRRAPPSAVGLLDELLGHDALSRSGAAAELDAAARSLERVPAAFWRRPDAAALLVEVVAESAGTPRQPEIARLLLDGLDRGAGPADDLRSAEIEGVRDWLGAVPFLRNGLVRLPAEAMVRRAATGLTAPPVAAAVDLGIAERVRRVLDALRDDPRHAALARLALDAMAAIRLPRTLLASTDPPLGGVADVSNRGPLDRLLTSELAHDDLTLAVRIARNEALYLRREPPTTAKDGARLVFVDTGVRTWGVARVFAAAVALALAATTPRRGDLTVFHDDDGRLAPVDLGATAGVDRLLGALATTAQPTRAVLAFLGEVDAAASAGREAVLITHPSCLADPELAAVLPALAARGVHVVTVDRDGAFELCSLGPRGRSRAGGGRLDLTDVLRPAPVGVAPLRASGAEWATIDRVAPFPLRLPVGSGLRVVRAWRGTALAIVNDGRLVRWDQRGRGARQLSPGVPHGPLALFEVDSRGTLHAVFGPVREGPATWIRVDLASGAVTRAALDLVRARPRGAFLLDGAVCLVVGRRVLLFRDAGVGRPLALPRGLHPLGGRFFGSAWRERWALALGPDGLRIEALPWRSAETPHFPDRPFDREGHDGPFVCLDSRRVLDLATGEELRFSDPSRSLPIARSDCLRAVFEGGRRALVSIAPGRCAVLDFDSGVTFEVRPPFLDPALRGVVDRASAPRFRFDAIARSAGGRVLLERRGSWFELRTVAHAVQLLRVRDGVEKVAPRRFAQTRVGFGGSGVRRWCASWPSGATARLDSRGLLHLRCAESEPELTIVLTASRSGAAMSSDGLLHGRDEAFVEPARTDAVAVERRLRRFVEAMT